MVKIWCRLEHKPRSQYTHPGGLAVAHCLGLKVSIATAETAEEIEKGYHKGDILTILGRGGSPLISRFGGYLDDKLKLLQEAAASKGNMQTR